MKKYFILSLIFGLFSASIMLGMEEELNTSQPEKPQLLNFKFTPIPKKEPSFDEAVGTIRKAFKNRKSLPQNEQTTLEDLLKFLAQEEQNIETNLDALAAEQRERNQPSSSPQDQNAQSQKNLENANSTGESPLTKLFDDFKENDQKNLKLLKNRLCASRRLLGLSLAINIAAVVAGVYLYCTQFKHNKNNAPEAEKEIIEEKSYES